MGSIQDEVRLGEVVEFHGLLGVRCAGTCLKPTTEGRDNRTMSSRSTSDIRAQG